MWRLPKATPKRGFFLVEALLFVLVSAIIVASLFETVRPLIKLYEDVCFFGEALCMHAVNMSRFVDFCLTSDELSVLSVGVTKKVRARRENEVKEIMFIPTGDRCLIFEGHGSPSNIQHYVLTSNKVWCNDFQVTRDATGLIRVEYTLTNGSANVPFRLFILK